MRSVFSNQKPKSKHGKSKSLSIPTMTYVIIFIRKLKNNHKKTKYRSHILNEWRTTENSYCRDLQLTVKMIKHPLIEEYKLINEIEADIIFSELDNMISLSKMMITIFEDARKKVNPYSILIGKQLVSIAPGYRIYRKYFENHNKKQHKLNELVSKQESKMKEIESQLQKQMKKIDPKKQLITIKDCMEVPLYRVFKYVLLMKDYIKKLPDYHPDYHSLNQAMKTFHDINTQNNQLMNSIEKQEKQNHLESMYGNILKNTRTLVAEMKGDTIYSGGKIYLFNDLIILTKIITTLGSQREEKFESLDLDEFSHIQEQSNMKYFKNILILIGQHKSRHLFFPDEGSRFEVYKGLNKIIKCLRIKANDWRKVDHLQKQKNSTKKKLTFTLKTNQVSDDCFRPEFRVQILGFEVRPLSTLNNDTVYVTRFMIPVYYQDQLLQIESEAMKSKLKKESNQKKLTQQGERYDEQQELEQAGIKKLPHKSINQRIQIHFSKLQSLYDIMVTKCPTDLPNIDPITKDTNIYSKGKKKTKFFQMRKFFIEEFFNYIFRYQPLLENPLWFIDELRINSRFWEYATKRNSSIRYPTNPPENYGEKHCKTCNRANIKSLQEFEHYRTYFLGDGNHLANRSSDKYCFNFFSLIRFKLLDFSYICFGSLERILLYYHYSEGRLDYPFLMHNQAKKTRKSLRIHLPSVDDECITLTFEDNSTVGEIIDEIGMNFKMKICFDYELLAVFNNKRRILDRDSFLIDAVNALDIQYTELDSKQENESKGFIGCIKRWGHDVFGKQHQQKNKLYFFKTTYLLKSLQLQSMEKNRSKQYLEIEKIYWSIRHGLIKLNDRQFIELASYYYCLKQTKNIEYFSSYKLNKAVLYKVIPEDKIYAFENYAEMKRQIANNIEKEKDLFLKNNKNVAPIIRRIFDIIWQLKDYYTFYISVEPKEIPQSVCQSIPSTCWIGVSYKHIVVTTGDSDTSPMIYLDIEDINFYTSVFSIFIIHPELGQFRFDTKMLYNFGQLVRKYQMIGKRFPQHRA